MSESRYSHHNHLGGFSSDCANCNPALEDSSINPELPPYRDDDLWNVTCICTAAYIKNRQVKPEEHYKGCPTYLRARIESLEQQLVVCEEGRKAACEMVDAQAVQLEELRAQVDQLQEELEAEQQRVSIAFGMLAKPDSAASRMKSQIVEKVREMRNSSLWNSDGYDGALSNLLAEIEAMELKP